MATPSQPMIGERKANRSPDPAIQRPSVVVMPVRFITYARPRTAITVTIASLSWSSEPPNTLIERAGLTRRIAIVIRPEISSSVPAAGSQLRL